MKTKIIPISLISLAVIFMLFAVGRSRPDRVVAPPPSPSLTISASPYKHFTGAFSISLPTGWHVTEGDEGIVVSEPNGGAMFNVLLVNSGGALDSKAMHDYVDAVETNYFATFANYSIAERRLAGNCIRLGKTLESKGAAKKVLSRYCYHDGVMSQQDLWADANRFEEYSALYETVTGSLVVNLNVTKTIKIYREQYVFSDSRRGFEFQVPYSWKRITTNEGEKFVAPDGAQTMWYMAVANEAALKWLDDQFADVGVTGDRALKDGSRLVAWHSVAGGVKGHAVITSRGTLVWAVKSSEYEKFALYGGSLLNNYRFVK